MLGPPRPAARVGPPLDRCRDLRRQRRARMVADEDPDKTHVRPASQAENYPS
ncbi:DUF2630 family protein [Streptomyces sp. JH14]|uniref:DUF2630 family protein n=1 Tax=Streptomyces sp. JH14 TaxID=2793630 RepID=UPI0023F84911|nr:DUF2630 family protein [Streptomyces sp. JH14]